MGALTVNLTNEPTSNLNLTVHDSGDTSPPEDLIIFFFSINRFFSSKKLDVFLYSGNDNRNYAYYPLQTESKATPASARGLASILEVKNAQGDLLNGTDFVSEADRNNTLETIAEKTWIIRTDEVQFASIPKKLFFRSDNFDFSDVHRISFIFQSMDAGVRACVGDILLVGGGKNDSGAGPSDATRGGVQGTYRYRVTFLNTTTGNRSNPGTVTQIAKDVNRGYVALSGIPTSADSQVDAREIWRTMGDGTRFFKAATISDNVTTTFDDQVADYAGLDSQEGVDVLSNEELPLDNDPPDADFDQHIIDKLTAFWISSTASKSGRVYFSPIGRPESKKGFIDVSSSGDPLQRLFVFQGVRFVMSESKLYRIAGDDPYITFEIAGVPGVSNAQRRTLAVTPFGVVWQSNDGIRIYDGARCRLLHFDPVGKLFRGESAENLSAFEGTVATFARGEYYISDDTQCLALDIETGSWRHVGFDDITALYYEWDNDVLQGGRADQVELLEEEGTTSDAGTAIDIAWETAGADTPQDIVLFIERVFIDIDTASQTVTPVLVHQYATDTLTTINNSSRSSVEREIQEMVLRPSIRFTGSVSAQVTLYDVELEYRQVELGINIEGSQRVTVPGRWREDLGDNGRIVFEIDPEIKFLDQTDELYVIDRLTVEHDAEGTSITPRIELRNTTVTLSSLSPVSTRTVDEIEIDRIGPINELSLDAPFFTSGTRPKIYRIELHIRPLRLGIRLPDGNRMEVAGRSTDATAEITFEIDPSDRRFDAQSYIPLVERVYIDTNTEGNNISGMLVFENQTVGLASQSSTVRDMLQYDVNYIGRLRELTLSGDFVTNAIKLYGVEIQMRELPLGVSVLTNS